MSGRRLLLAAILVAAGDAEDLLSLVQLAPPVVQERGGSASYALAAPAEGQAQPDDGPECLSNKETWLFVELLGGGLLGFDRMFLGGTNVLMGLMKLVWCLPCLGTWATVDRIVIVSNAINKLDSVSTLDMHCGFRGDHIHRAYLLGIVCAVATLVVIQIGLAVSAYAMWEITHRPEVTGDKIAMRAVACLAGMNLGIALSVPLLVLATPAGTGLLVAYLTSHIWSRWFTWICSSTPSSEPITINIVKATNGEHLCAIEADLHWKVPRLKMAIRSVLCVPTQMQRLVYENRPLVDVESLQAHLGATGRLDQLCGSITGKRKTRVFEVAILQHCIADDPPPSTPSPVSQCSIDGSGAAAEETVTPPAAG